MILRHLVHGAPETESRNTTHQLRAVFSKFFPEVHVMRKYENILVCAWALIVTDQRLMLGVTGVLSACQSAPLLDFGNLACISVCCEFYPTTFASLTMASNLTKNALEDW